MNFVVSRIGIQIYAKIEVLYEIPFALYYPFESPLQYCPCPPVIEENSMSYV